jgi:hypothetical protein
MEPLDWTNAELLRERADSISRAVNLAIEAADVEGYRTHLGASVIGRECLRYLYYHFHWMHRETYSGRELRLFNAGHDLEPRVRYWLRQIGFQFLDGCDENNPQLLFRAVNGHFGGSVDGVFIAPDWGITEPCLLECKTSGTGAGFNNLDKGLLETKPEHYVQDCTYGKGLNLTQCLYVAENKNDSDWKFILVKLNEQIANEALRKAEFIILEATEPPKKISNRRNFFICNMCKMRGVCHDGEPIDKNCRSCQFSKPVENGQWFCRQHNAVIPADFIPLGCDSYAPLKS